MARVAPEDESAPASVWVAAVDTETGRAMVSLAVLLPEAVTAEEEAEAALESAMAAAVVPADVATALRVRWPVAAEPVAAELERLAL